MKPIVQISLDLISIPEALETAAMALRAGIDWLEAGTPLIIAEGMNGVRELRKAFPKTPIVADLKTMDGGWLEAELMADRERLARGRQATRGRPATRGRRSVGGWCHRVCATTWRRVRG